MLVIYLFVSAALLCLVLYLSKIVLLKISILYCLVSLNRGARCSSVVKAFAHGAMGCRGQTH